MSVRPPDHPPVLLTDQATLARACVCPVWWCHACVLVSKVHTRLSLSVCLLVRPSLGTHQSTQPPNNPPIRPPAHPSVRSPKRMTSCACMLARRTCVQTAARVHFTSKRQQLCALVLPSDTTTGSDRGPEACPLVLGSSSPRPTAPRRGQAARVASTPIRSSTAAMIMLPSC